MKYLLIAAMLMLTACQSSTEFGECVGVVDKQDVKLEYKLSVRNTVIGLFFSSLLFPPVLVLANETFCPVGVTK